MFTSCTKRLIGKFHALVVQRRQRNVPKSLIYVQSCCFKLLLFVWFFFMTLSLSLPLPSPSSLMKLPDGGGGSLFHSPYLSPLERERVPRRSGESFKLQLQYRRKILSSRTKPHSKRAKRSDANGRLWGGALRDEPKNGFIGDSALHGCQRSYSANELEGIKRKIGVIRNITSCYRNKYLGPAVQKTAVLLKILNSWYYGYELGYY